MSMNPRVRELWLAALRSGTYLQGQSKLAWVEPNGQVRHCCLGVLCEVARLDGVPLTVTEHEGGVTLPANYRRYDGADNFLPEVVQVWAGFDKHDLILAGDVLVDGRDDGTTLSSLNDAGSTFDEIADLVEEQL